MSLFTDGKYLLYICLYEDNLPYYSGDFYSVGLLDKVEVDSEDAYVVKDVYCLIEQANDWRYRRGDYYGDSLRGKREVSYQLRSL